MNKDIVATHEVGHALLVLKSEMRDAIGHVRIYLDERHEWRGECKADVGCLKLRSGNDVLNIAKGLAGPLIQYLACPDANDNALFDRISGDDYMVDVVADVFAEGGMVSNYWGDFIGILT